MNLNNDFNLIMLHISIRTILAHVNYAMSPVVDGFQMLLIYLACRLYNYFLDIMVFGFC